MFKNTHQPGQYIEFTIKGTNNIIIDKLKFIGCKSISALDPTESAFSSILGWKSGWWYKTKSKDNGSHDQNTNNKCTQTRRDVIIMKNTET